MLTTVMMPAKIQTFKISTLTLLLGGLFGCANLAQSVLNVNVTNIGNIQQNWQNYSTVYLQGQVSSQAPLLGSAAYQLQDASGSIWVLTQQTLPNLGDRVLIKGKVQYQSIPIAGQELGEVYVQELKRL